MMPDELHPDCTDSSMAVPILEDTVSPIAPLPEMTPQEAMELILAGRAVENVRIRRLRLRGLFEKPVRFRNCVLIQPDFDAATFQEDVALIGCTVERLNGRKKCTFAKSLEFVGTTFTRANFAKFHVSGPVNAAHTVFRGQTAFADSEFAGRVSFWEARFDGWVDFKCCRFADEADFRTIHADQGFVLTRCHFQNNFLFRGSQVQKKFQADGSWFDAMLDLSKAKLFDFVYLEGIGQGPGMRWAFQNAVADRVLVRPDQIEGRLASELAGKHEEAMQEYGLLKRSYQSLHRFDAEDWAFYRFKVNQRRAKLTTWRRPWTVWRTLADWLFLDIGSGYGTKPGRAVRMAAVIILGFAALYAAYAELFFVEVIPFDGEQTTLPNRVMIGLTTSVAVFTSGMGGIRDVAKGWMNVPVMIESVMGTLLFGLFIVAFSRKVIR